MPIFHRPEELCDCNWSGVCILYEKQWQSKTGLSRSNCPTARTELTVRVNRRERIATDVYRLEMTVTEDLARELGRTGSFVFLRRPEDPQYFHFPVGVMKVTGTAIQMVVEAVGPKSQRLLDAESDEVVVRGPYYNGVLGQPWIDNITYGKILLVTGGMGQPAALPIAARLAANRNEVVALAAPGRLGTVFIGQELRELGITVHIVDSMRGSGISLITDWLRDGTPRYDLVVSAGSDEQHYGVIGAMQAAEINVPMAATNNATMCCGEGICGSCQRETQDSGLIRTCKVQADFGQLLS